MSRSLKQAVNCYLEDINLNAGQLKELEALMDADSGKTARIKPQHRWMTVSGMTVSGMTVSAVAAFALAFILSVVYFEKPTDIPLRIAEEVVHNHFKLKPLEIKTDSIEGIRRYFSKLDFMPMNSALLKDTGLSLIGGRYCSLQGITAAQLRVKGEKNEVVQTFYQTEYRRDVFGKLPDIDQGDQPVEVYVKGIKVKIWVEKGLVFALTEAPS